MRNSILIALLFLTSITSCTSDNELSQEEEAQNLRELFSEIENLALSVDCENAAEWSFTGYGIKACGGPIGFIAYSVNIDVDLFLELIEEHREKQRAFNKKWGISSDCSVPTQPAGVICQNGSPVLDY
ncbi:MAG: hypothetical protein COB60_09245 [Flavobacteriaceae bacterium]|nr:MAG: hypothetical protein COB60_09245 [Flavobacteriaceae bacterium]